MRLSDFDALGTLVPLKQNRKSIILYIFFQLKKKSLAKLRWKKYTDSNFWGKIKVISQDNFKTPKTSD